jgi:DNA-binding MarR family transcriptional regulator
VAAALGAHQVADDAFEDTLTEFLGLNRTDARCLDLIGREGRVTAGRLATMSGLTTGAVTVVIDRLSSAGSVRRVRDPDDRRKVYVEMTPELDAIRARVSNHFEKLAPAILGEFSPKQIEGIVAFLEVRALVKRALSEVLRTHIAPKAAKLGDREERARAFERAARGAITRAAAEPKPEG